METMVSLKDETISALQDLIEINRDSSKGFNAAAENVSDVRIATIFREMGQERQAFASELARYVRINDEQPNESGSWQGKVHRWWIDMRTSVSGNDLKVVLEEAERGEDKIKAVYENAMKDVVGNPLSDVLHRQYARVKKAHDRVRDARDIIKAADSAS